MADEHATYKTKRYDQFKMLLDNRQTARGHINKLKDAITSNPEILKAQPILVNENMEVIDGQHRLLAASELGIPIYYTKVKGLNINTARAMNTIQKRWSLDDYAYSFAKAGNVHYKAYNKYRHEWPGVTQSVMMVILAGRETKGIAVDFRKGEFVIGRDQADIEWLLERLGEIREATGHEIPLSRSFVSALLKSLDNEDFSYPEFITKLKAKPDMFFRTTTVKDALRMIEDIFNYKKSTNAIRLY